MKRSTFKKVSKFSALSILILSLSSCNKGTGCPTWSLESAFENTMNIIGNIIQIF